MSEGTNISNERIQELTHERIDLVPFDEGWGERYRELETLLSRSLPVDLVTRIAHIGSTSVPGLWAKPIVDVQVEVKSLDRVRREVVPIMKDLGFEYIWRPTMGEKAPFYAWFIQRNAKGERTAHVHMVEPDEASSARILFRERLRTHPDEAAQYERLKRELAALHGNDRAAYTRGKSAFVTEIVRRARVSAA
ncbi:MAG: GrpB family protein [Flavobacteriales bacterium]|nr:GrpB family protein [Flavobacteriales bacterium]